MARTLLCEIVTPERIVYKNEVRLVVAMTTTGEVGILPLHAPLVATLAPGEIRLQYGDSASDWDHFSVSGGYIQVHEDKVLVLADDALLVSQIDAGRARESLQLIQERLASLPEDAIDERAEAVRDLAWYEQQLKAVERQRH
jgi:F-type H+-transporting ATPase subunit epsilon